MVEAARLFSTNGIRATSVVEIADAVGVKAPAIYYHFKNRHAIVNALLDYALDDIDVFATSVAHSSQRGPATDRLVELVAQNVERLATAPFDLWFVWSISDTDQRLYPDFLAGFRAWTRAAGRLIERGKSEGDFRPIETSLAVTMISGLIYGALQHVHRGQAVDPAAVGQVATNSIRPR